MVRNKVSLYSRVIYRALLCITTRRVNNADYKRTLMCHFVIHLKSYRTIRFGLVPKQHLAKLNMTNENCNISYCPSSNLFFNFVTFLVILSLLLSGHTMIMYTTQFLWGLLKHVDYINWLFNLINRFELTHCLHQLNHQEIHSTCITF